MYMPSQVDPRDRTKRWTPFKLVKTSRLRTTSNSNTEKLQL